MARLAKELLVATVWIAIGLQAASARGQDRPQIAYVVQPVIRLGERHQEITLHGHHLQQATGLLCDIPIDVTLVDQKPDRATFRVKAGADAWPGVHQIRVLAPGAVSAPRLLLLDELPLVQQQPGSHSLRQAQPVTLPAAVVGQTERGKVDYYRFELAAPAMLTLEVVARRLGIGPQEKLGGDETGRLLTIDPVLQILDSTARKLAVVDDTPGLTSDIRFRHRFDRAGEYFVAIHDVQYHGGPEHQYVLRVGDFPDRAVYSPPGRPLGAEPDHDDTTDVYSAGELLDGVRWLSARSRSGLRSLAVPQPVGRYPEVTAVEPNEPPDAARLVSIPATLTGQLRALGDVERFALGLKTGQKVRVSTMARTLGSTVWVAVRILGPDRAAIAATIEDGAATPEGSAADPRFDPPPITFEARTDGRHIVQVERRLGPAGPAAVYRLEVEPFAGSFSLRATSDFLAVPRGGTAVFAVDVLREQYDGPVEVSATSSLAGLTPSTGSVSGPAATRAIVTVTAPPHCGEAAGWFVVSGRAQIGELQVQRVADLTALYDAPPGLRPNQGHFFFLRPLPPVVTRRIALVVTEPAPFALDLSEELLTATAGSSCTMAVVCRRSGGFTGPVALRVEGLPAKVTVEAPAIAEGTDRSNIQLKIPGDAPAGRYLIAVVGEATDQGRKWTSATPAIVLEVKR